MSSDSDNQINQSDISRKRRHSLRWQIMSIAAIGTLGFFIFLAVTLSESKDRADLLKNIRDVRYPAQEKLLAAHHGLEYIDSNLEQAIATSNANLLDHTMTLAVNLFLLFRFKSLQAHFSQEKTRDVIERLPRE